MDSVEQPIAIAQLLPEAEDLDEVDAIALASFENPQFSAREELARPWARCWVARDGVRPLAFLIAWHIADELHVLNVATLPSARRRRIATALMRAALDYAKERRVRLLLLEVRRSNRPALQLYRGLGFTATSVRSGYYADNGEDAIEMVLVLDPMTGSIQPGREEILLDV